MAFLIDKNSFFRYIHHKNNLFPITFSASIMILCAIGAFGLNNSVDDFYVMFGFGLIVYYITTTTHDN